VIWILEQFVLLALPKFADQGLKNITVSVRLFVPAWAHSSKPAAAGLQLWSSNRYFFKFVPYSVSVFQTIAISVRFFGFFFASDAAVMLMYSISKQNVELFATQHFGVLIQCDRNYMLTGRHIFSVFWF